MLNAIQSVREAVKFSLNNFQELQRKLKVQVGIVEWVQVWV